MYTYDICLVLEHLMLTSLIFWWN